MSTLTSGRAGDCDINLRERRGPFRKNARAPKPAMVLPNMKARELRAAAQRAEAALNSNKDIGKVVLTGRKL